MFLNQIQFYGALKGKKEIITKNKQKMMLDETQAKLLKFKVYKDRTEKRDTGSRPRRPTQKLNQRRLVNLGHSLGSPIITATQEPRNVYPLEVQAGQLSVETCGNYAKNSQHDSSAFRPLSNFKNLVISLLVFYSCCTVVHICSFCHRIFSLLSFNLHFNISRIFKNIVSCAPWALEKHSYTISI